jgi:peptide/nickel transport system permease protein
MSVTLAPEPEVSGARTRTPARRGGTGVIAQVLRLLGQTASVAVGVVLITFLLVRLVPGDPTTVILGSTATPDARRELRQQLHLDGSIFTQFREYLVQLLHGDLGSSVVSPSITVASLVRDALPVTLSIVAFSMLFAVVLGVPLGLIAGIRRGSVDAGVRGVLTLLLTMPPFFFGLVLLALFAGLWPVLPAGGWGAGWPDNLRFVLLPSLALAAYLMPLIARAVRQGARDAMRQPWVEAAIARGASDREIAVRQVLPVAVLPVITLLGYNAGALLAGAVVVESVFGIPGIGQLLVTAMSQRDYPIIQGIALVAALVVVACNVVADLAYVAVDPRAKRG